ncbi:MAG: ATP-grasp domain-containing protein [Actinomycetota bacterium]
MSTDGSRERQERFVERLKQVGLPGLETGTIVIVQSLSYPVSEARKIVGIALYDERMMCMLLLLRNPGLRIVYVSAMPIDEAVVDYYLSFIPEVTDARERLALVSVGHAEPRPLSQKLIEDPRALQEIRAAVPDVDDAYILPFNVTAFETELSRVLGIPLYGPELELVALGSKSGSRRIARRVGVPILPGREDVRNEAEILAAFEHIRSLQPAAEAAVIKLNNGFSGQGNAIVSLDGFSPPISDATTVFIAAEESWPSFIEKIAGEGAVVEELMRGEEVVSPSVQMRIAPGGDFEVVSTHDQILGGPDDQVYLGCRFPARSEYREAIQSHASRVAEALAAERVIGSFGLDFVVAPGGDLADAYMSEINLRLGGTTHPFTMARLATEGTYDRATGELVCGGVPKYYISSDNLKSDTYIGLQPADVIAVIRARGLAFDLHSRTGATLHLFGALRAHGKLGTVCIANTAEDADILYREVVAAIGAAATARR